MTVRLGMFTMPFHHPARDYADLLEEDQEAIVLADRLGFSEAFVGEHFSSWSERITSPLIFLATVISRTRDIRLGTGVINMPHVHPATVAAQAAMFDQLARGRFIMGIGPGGSGERPRALRLGPGRAAPADGARVHRHGAEALVPGSAVPDRRPLLEDLARAGHLARVQGRLHPPAVPAAASADRPLDPDAELDERPHRRRARLDSHLGPVLPPAIPPGSLGAIRRRLRESRPTRPIPTSGACRAACS